MCGIAGCIAFEGGASPDVASVERMTEFMRHRGPDGSGTYFDGPVGLGHRRLSIIDIAGGAQPMTSTCGRYTICFNGEIYNYIELRDRLGGLGHTFRTTSDTEVLLASCIQWGRDAPQHLNGMFAFAFYDRQDRKLLLVRDHLGIKPLYYHRGADRLLFASDVGALAVHASFPRKLCAKALSHFFTWRVVPGPYTIYEDTFALPPGSLLEVDAAGHLRQERYWDIPVRRCVPRTDPDKAEQRLVALLEDALRLQIRADVPVGAFLSGGVDSSTVAYWMSKVMAGKPLTFTIGFEGREKDFDESRWAAEVARHIDSDHHLHVLKSYQTVQLMERAAWFFNQPCGTGLPNYFVSAVARKHVKVALAGVGGDECYGGYLRFRVASNPAYYNFGSFDPAFVFLRSLCSFTKKDKRRFFTPEFYGRVRDEPSINFIRAQSRHIKTRNVMDKLCYIDMRHFLLNDLLFNLDKMSMAHSLEVRVPLLDYRLVELAMEVPPSLKVLHGEQKILLKRAMYRRLPRSVFLRAKRGFSLPKQVWLKGMEDFVRSLINRTTVTHRGLFRWSEAEKYLAAIFSADGRTSWRDANNLWNVVSFELWARQFLDRVPDTSPPKTPAGLEFEAGGRQ